MRSAPSPATGELYLTDLVAPRPRGRPPRQRGRLRGRRTVRRHQRPLAAGRRRVEPARPPQRGAHAQRRHDARPVHGLPRLDGRAGRRRHPRAERHPARRDERRGGERHRRRAASSSTRRSGPASQVWASIVESSTVEDGATVGPFSHLRPGSVVGRGRDGRQLRRAQEHPPRRRARKQHHMSYLGDAEVGEGVNIGAGRHHRELRRHAQAPDDDRRRRVHRRGHDDRRAAGHRRGRPDRRGRGRDAATSRPGKLAVGVPARIREPRAKPPDPGADGLDGHAPPDRRHRHPDPARGRLRGGRDRPRHDAPDAHRPARRRGQPQRASGSSGSSPSPAASWRSPRSG